MARPAIPLFVGAATTRRLLAHPLRANNTLFCANATKATTPVLTRSIATYPNRPTSRRKYQQHNALQTRPRCSHQPRPSAISRRRYHSHDHPAPAGPFTPAEAALLSAAYHHVPSHGFTPESLALGARDAGLLDISPSILPDGAFSLIRWHLHTQRASLAGKAEKLAAVEKDKPMAVAEKVEALAWERLKGNVEAGIVGRWQEALAIMAQPSYVPTSVKELAQLADEIVYLAGDVSVDPSWYTKRASLSAIYAAAELFQTTDQSPEFRETRAFLRRRLDEASQAGGTMRSIGEWIGFNAGAAVNVLRSKGVRI